MGIQPSAGGFPLLHHDRIGDTVELCHERLQVSMERHACRLGDGFEIGQQWFHGLQVEEGPVQAVGEAYLLQVAPLGAGVEQHQEADQDVEV